MAYLAATDVTVTLDPRDRDFTMLGKTWTWPQVDFGDSAKQYTALGIPMPAIGNYGFLKQLFRVFIEQPANGFIYHFDRANLKLRIFLGSARAAITIANHVGVAPTGNVAAPANHANIQVPAPANHAHDLVILANNAGVGTQVIAAGANTANHALVSNTAGGDTIPGGNTANKGGVEMGAVPAPANIANLTHNAPAFTGDAPANLVHSISGGGAIAEAALAEMDDGVAPAATTLYTEMVGQ